MRDAEIRTGRVSSVDYENGMLQVVYTDKDNAVTATMPYANFNREYSMPDIGELVVTAHLSNGTSRGVVLGSMWNKKNTPEEAGNGLYRKELSKIRGTAYQRYADKTGEYLLKAPILMLHGVDRTDVEGPEVNIAANIKTSFESPEHKAVVKSVEISGMEENGIEMSVLNNIRIIMDLADLEALIRKIEIETVEELKLLSGKELEICAKEEINLEDSTFKTTLSDILERLEHLDHNTSVRK